MFVLSVKTSKRKLMVWSGIFVCILFFSIVYLNSNNYNSICVSSNKNISTKASDNTSRVEFLSKFGWKVENEPTEISEVTIPEEFNNTYEKYNQIQKSQGFNLEKNKGQKCKRFTYKVLNYKNNPSGVNANILVLKDKIIGGDICSVELSGFMHGFEKPEDSIETSCKINWQPRKPIEKSNNITKTTYRDNLSPDPNMLEAPVD